MPYVIRKVRNKNCYSVKNIESGKVHAKCATKEKAKKQIQLLNAIEHGWKPSKSPKKMKSKAKDGYTKKIKPTISPEWLDIFRKNDYYEKMIEEEIKELKEIEELRKKRKKDLKNIKKDLADIIADMKTDSRRIY
jgi:hypothetical protein